jgi:hypothetical protein
MPISSRTPGLRVNGVLHAVAQAAEELPLIGSDLRRGRRLEGLQPLPHHGQLLGK